MSALIVKGSVLDTNLQFVISLQTVQTAANGILLCGLGVEGLLLKCFVLFKGFCDEF